MSFPTCGILDDFDRADTGPPPGGSWSSESVQDATGTLQVSSNQLADLGGGGGTYRGGYLTTSYGPDSEAYVTWPALPTDVTSTTLYVRMSSPGTGSLNAYQLRFIRDDSKPGGIARLGRVDASVVTQLGADINDTNGALAAGDKQGVDVVSDTITAYRWDGAWITLGSRTDSTYSSAGQVGLRSGDGGNAVRFDDFGGGTVVAGGATGLASDTPMPIMGRGATW